MAEMALADKHVMSKKDAKILQAANELLSMYEDRFSDAARNCMRTNGPAAYSFAKTAAVFATAHTVMNSALVHARIHAEQEALIDRRDNE